MATWWWSLPDDEIIGGPRLKLDVMLLTVQTPELRSSIRITIQYMVRSDYIRLVYLSCAYNTSINYMGGRPDRTVWSSFSATEPQSYWLPSPKLRIFLSRCASLLRIDLAFDCDFNVAAEGRLRLNVSANRLTSSALEVDCARSQVALSAR